MTRWVVIAVAGLFALPALAADVSIEPAATYIQPGGTAIVGVAVSGVAAPGLAGFQVEISFDPAVVAAADPNAAAPEQPFEPATWLLTSTGRAAVGIVSIDNVAGTVTIAYGTEPGPPPALGAGTLAEIEFTAIGSGQTSLTLTHVVLADGDTPPRAIPGANMDGLLSAVGGVTDNDGDFVPENFDGLGAPGEQACVGGATTGCDDNCPLLANTDQADANGNGLGDACEDLWTLQGTAQGGAVAFQIAGVDLVVTTNPGESAALVAANIAAAINGDATLAALGIRATSSGDDVSANTSIDARFLDDPGLAIPLPLAPWMGWLLTGALSAVGSRAIRRRSSRGPETDLEDEPA